jgi:4-amino-4-deoxy-L-arabinose transferase-like glycosyltransferase
MINAALADQQNRLTDERDRITRATVLKCFVIFAVVAFVLRIFYAGHLYEDDGLWFTAAEEIVRGKALYREIYFDKPPGLAVVYALLFSVFGAHLITIRLFTIAYSIAISAVLYLFGSRLYDKRVGLLAAGFFAVFSTTYTTGHVQGLGTDFLMALPYTAGAFLFVLVKWDSTRQSLHATLGGMLAGIAFQINPKGIFDLIFFAVMLFAWDRFSVRYASGFAAFKPIGTNRRTSSLRLFALGAVGLVAGSLPFLVYIVAARSFREYWLYVWDWGARYGSYNPPSKVFVAGLTRSIDYFALNNTLLIGLVFLSAATVRQISHRATSGAADLGARRTLLADSILLIWLVVSYAGVLLGGRLYSHYFFQILPCLCLICARGLTEIRSRLNLRDAGFRAGVTTILVLGFLFTIVRFHGRTAVLAADLFRGRKSEVTTGWFHERIDSEERMVASVVRELPEGEDAGDLPPEAIRAGGPRETGADGPEDYVFVWGYRPEIYYISGLLPASRYLSTQPLTGVPADVHYFSEDDRSVLDEGSTALAREQLILDLRETGPKYIVDELGMFNAELSINSYPELTEFMKAYKPMGSVARFMIYCRRDLREKNRRQMREQDR